MRLRVMGDACEEENERRPENLRPGDAYDSNMIILNSGSSWGLGRRLGLRAGARFAGAGGCGEVVELEVEGGSQITVDSVGFPILYREGRIVFWPIEGISMLHPPCMQIMLTLGYVHACI